MLSDFKIAYAGRAKHGILWEAMQENGWTQRQTAEYLKMSPSYFGKLINLKMAPKSLTSKQEERLYKLTGLPSAKVFPASIYTEGFIAMEKEFALIVELTPQELAEIGMVTVPECPEKAFERSEVRKILLKAIESMPYTQGRVFELCFFEDFDFVEIGRILRMRAEDVQELVSCGLHELRTSRNPFHRDLRDHYRTIN